MRIIVFILAAIVVLASCRSTKKIQTAITKKDTVATAVTDNKIDSTALIKNALARLNENYVDFKTFSAIRA